MRYYISNSSIFDSAPHYELEKIKAALRLAGFKNVREARQYGWRNQPKVATFEGRPEKAAKILESTPGIHPLIQKWGVVVREKDWG